MTPLQALEPSLPSDTVPPTNILIVDDEPANLLALEAILEPLGTDVKLIRACSGIEALKHALKMEFCVVLLDVQMPEMDGLETASLLRKRPRTRDLPIIFLTAISKDASFVARGYDVGAVDYLFKPYDPDTLRTKVATFVELGRKNVRMRAQNEALRIGKERELDALKRSSERRYEDLANSVPQVVWTADPAGTLTYHNHRWTEIASPTGANDSAFAAIAHPADLLSFVSGFGHAVRASEEWEAELRLGSKTRGYRHHLVRAAPRRDEDGTVVGWVGTATDIDVRVKADRALRMLADASLRLNRSLEEPGELEEVLRGALPILGDAIRLDISEPQGAASEKARLRVGRDPGAAAVLDDPRFELGPATVVYSGRPEVYLDVDKENESARAIRDSERNPEASERGVEHLRFLAELGVRSYVCVPLSTRDRIIGTLTFVRFTAGERLEQVDVDLGADLARRIAVSVDNGRLHATTERRRVELELANRSKDVFLATLSHELRTPLNAIVGWTDMMRKGVLEGLELTRAVETIDRNAHALSGLVADLLDVSRIVTGSLKIESKVVALGGIIEAAVQNARPAAQGKQVSFDVFLPEAGHVRGDPGRLRQVVANLVSNALKFTPEGGTISVHLETYGGRARVIVKDTGEGISVDFLPHVFERFRQAEVGRAKGLGLGLAIVKHLVEEHGGTVAAESAGKGRGATFIVDLPLAEAAAEPAPEEASTLAGEPQLAGVHVLIVEDDPDGNELVCAILERYGARVRSATNAADALDALDGERPDVLVSDIGLPDMDGMELIRQVRLRGGFESLPAVALTAYASRQDATKAIAAGFDAHVAKPVQPATLAGVVAKLFARASAPAPRSSKSTAA